MTDPIKTKTAEASVTDYILSSAEKFSKTNPLAGRVIAYVGGGAGLTFDIAAQSILFLVKALPSIGTSFFGLISGKDLSCDGELGVTALGQHAKKTAGYLLSFIPVPMIGFLSPSWAGSAATYLGYGTQIQVTREIELVKEAEDELYNIREQLNALILPPIGLNIFNKNVTELKEAINNFANINISYLQEGDLYNPKAMEARIKNMTSEDRIEYLQKWNALKEQPCFKIIQPFLDDTAIKGMKISKIKEQLRSLDCFGKTFRNPNLEKLRNQHPSYEPYEILEKMYADLINLEDNNKAKIEFLKVWKFLENAGVVTDAKKCLEESETLFNKANDYLKEYHTVFDKLFINIKEEQFNKSLDEYIYFKKYIENLHEEFISFHERHKKYIENLPEEKRPTSNEEDISIAKMNHEKITNFVKDWEKLKKSQSYLIMSPFLDDKAIEKEIKKMPSAKAIIKTYSCLTIQKDDNDPLTQYRSYDKTYIKCQKYLTLLFKQYEEKKIPEIEFKKRVASFNQMVPGGTLTKMLDFYNDTKIEFESLFEQNVDKAINKMSKETKYDCLIRDDLSDFLKNLPHEELEEGKNDQISSDDFKLIDFTSFTTKIEGLCSEISEYKISVITPGLITDQTNEEEYSIPVIYDLFNELEDLKAKLFLTKYPNEKSYGAETSRILTIEVLRQLGQFYPDNFRMLREVILFYDNVRSTLETKKKRTLGEELIYNTLLKSTVSSTIKNLIYGYDYLVEEINSQWEQEKKTVATEVQRKMNEDDTYAWLKEEQLKKNLTDENKISLKKIVMGDTIDNAVYEKMRDQELSKFSDFIDEFHDAIFIKNMLSLELLNENKLVTIEQDINDAYAKFFFEKNKEEIVVALDISLPLVISICIELDPKKLRKLQEIVLFYQELKNPPKELKNAMLGHFGALISRFSSVFSQLSSELKKLENNKVEEKKE